MGFLFDLVVVVSALALLLSLWARGVIAGTFIAFALVAIVVLLAVGRGARGTIGHIVRLGLRVGLPIVAFLTVAVTITGGDLSAILGVLGGSVVLLIALAGLYIMIIGPFLSRPRR
jgi:hypothetical protein